jgi:DNA-binding MarR family transcriptional regulator
LTEKQSPEERESETTDDGFELLDSLAGYNLRRAAAHQRERFRKAFAPYDIRPVQLTALIVILNNDRLGQSTLGEMLGMKRANVVKLLDELQERGLIRRKQSKTDRRAYDVHLTAKGRRLTHELLDVHERLEAELAESFGLDELRKLVELLRKFRDVPL